MILSYYRHILSLLSLSLSLSPCLYVSAVLNKPFSLVDSVDATLLPYRQGVPNIDYLNKGPDSLITFPTGEGKIQMYYLNNAGSASTTALYTWSGVKIDSPYTTAEYFPFAQALSPGPRGSNYVFATSIDTSLDAPPIYHPYGRVEVIVGSYSVWSQQQVLVAPEYVDRANYFGSSLAFDRENHQTLYVGCGNCSSLKNKGHGAIYLYDQGSKPGIQTWSQTQELYFTSLFNLGMERIVVSDDLLLADIYTNSRSHSDPSAVDATVSSASWTNARSTLLMRRDKGGKFRPEQILGIRSQTVTSFDVYDDTIVLGNQYQEAKGKTDLGAVFILAPTTLPPPAPGKPRPVQWSVQQVLYSTVISDNIMFGTSVSIDDNRMSILDGQTNNYLYERQSAKGKWSLQQVFSTLTLSNQPETILIDGSMVTLDDVTLNYYDEFQDVSCLFISLEDQFGDGWDAAYLVLTYPDGKTEHLQSRCDTYNPNLVRFCPREMGEKGLYRFSVVDAANKAKHFWEILWRVYNEDSATWKVGNWQTKMDYEWDPDNGKFYTRKIEKNLPSNATCTPCPTRPTEKPSPAYRSRHLKGDKDGGGTHHPTHTPAPTFSTSEGINWRYMGLNGEEWFNIDHGGAYYYVSDSKSRRLIASGTLCTNEIAPKLCWIDLPDGEYNIRVGGALLKTPPTLSWSYCSMTTALDLSTQTFFKISNEECIARGAHTKAAYCGSADGAANIVIELVILGVGSSSTLGAYDRSALSQAIALTFPGVATEDVAILSGVPSGSGFLIRAKITFRQSTTGYEILDIDGVDTLLANVENYMHGNGPRVIWSGLQSAEHKTIFYSASSIQFISADISGSKDIFPSTEVEEVVSYVDETSVLYSPDQSTDYTPLVINTVSASGYFVATIALIALIVGLTVYTRRRSIVTSSQSSCKSNLAGIDNVIIYSGLESSEHPTEELKSKKRVQLKDLKLNVPTISDLKQFVEDEDEVLKMMLSRT